MAQLTDDQLETVRLQHQAWVESQTGDRQAEFLKMIRRSRESGKRWTRAQIAAIAAGSGAGAAVVVDEIVRRLTGG